MTTVQSTVSLEQIEQAAERIKGLAYRTPCYPSFSEPGAYLKLECFQPTRSFKIRGASNKILLIPEEERKKRGLITASSGNHGLAVAYVAHKLAIDATIVLPENVVPEKLEVIRSLGARPVFAGSQQDERTAKAREIQKNEGQIFVHPFNDTEIIAGQATCGLEILEDVPDVRNVFVPIGGGGLLSGVSLAIKLRNPKVNVVGVQPEGSPSMYNSFRAKELSTIEKSSSIADGLLVRTPGDITFSIVRDNVDDIVLVSDEEIFAATAQLIKKEHILAEPSGAAAFAGLLKSRKNNNGLAEGKSAAVVSGGNISSEMLKKAVST